MKTGRFGSWTFLLIVALVIPAADIQAQSTFIYYQGHLNDNGNAATGNYDLRFSLFDSSLNGAQVGPFVVRNLSITNGSFGTELNFGMHFAGADRWLQLEARTNGAGSFVLLEPRQRVTAAPYSTYALSAATASNVSGGAVVSSLNTLKDAVTLLAGNNVTITTNGNSLTIASATGGGSSIWSQLGTNAYYATGRVGIGTTAPQTPIEVNGVARSTRGGLNAQYLQLDGGDTVAIRLTGQSVASAEKSLWIQNLTGETVPGNNNNIQFVLGTTNAPASRMTLTKDGNLILPLGGTGGSLSFGTPSFETGLTIAGANRADIRFDGSTLKLLAGATAGIPSAANGITINTSGNVGIGGSLTPVAKLEVVAQDALRLIGYQPFLTLLDSNTGYSRGRIQTVAGELILEPESFVNGSNPNTFLKVENSGNVSVKSITIRGGADVAEPFEISAIEVTKGSVMIIDSEHPGKLKLSDRAYDRRVAGIVSGANGINTGLALHQEGALSEGHNVALSGRVYVEADAAFGGIEPGDLLTTSATPGHAMKVTDYGKAQGAILGKAMSPLKEGRGMVLVLVTLQ